MIERSEREGVVCLRMNHGKASALDLEFLEALRDAFEQERDSGDAPVVLTGTGRIFSAGVDLFRLLDGGADYIARFLPALDAALLAMFRFPRPLVAAINGHAIAGGAVIACACDRRLCVDEGATIGVPELLVGVPFPVVALEMVRRVLPSHVLEAALFGGGTSAPAAARELGWVESLHAPDELEERATELARSLGTIPAASYALTKELLHAETEERLECELDRARARTLQVWSSSDVQAAIGSYVDRMVRK